MHQFDISTNRKNPRYPLWYVVAVLTLTMTPVLCAQSPDGPSSDTASEQVSGEMTAAELDGTLDHLAAKLDSPDQAMNSLKLFLMVTVLSVAPAILLMTTSFLRISIVLGLLRQALGTQQNPSNQVIGALALFISALIMAPTWTTVYEDAIVPYSEEQISGDQAWTTARYELVQFMGTQIDKAGNSDDVWLFYDHLPESAKHSAGASSWATSPEAGSPLSYHDIPMQALLPAFMISELKTAFLIGFMLFLPFLVLDIVISSVTNAMGMMMLPPTTISLPFKIMLFVLVDGWHLIVGMLLESFG